MRIRSLGLLAALAFCGNMQSHAGLFLNDPLGFDNAVAGYNTLGIERFENTFIEAPSGMTGLDSSDGEVLNPALGLRVYASIALMGLGPNSGFDVSSKSIWDPFDGALTLTLSPTLGGASGVSLNVLSIGGSSEIGPTVQIYSEDDNLLGGFTVPGATTRSETGFVGFVADGGEAIGKIVLTAEDGNAIGFDNFYAVTAVPEPGWAGLGAGVFVIGIALVQRWRRTR